MATKPTLAERERALLEAARREAAAKQSGMAPAANPSAAAPAPAPARIPGPAASAAPALQPAASISRPVQAAPQAGMARPAEALPQLKKQAPPEVPMEERLALLMAAEQVRKEQRDKVHNRWKYGAVGVLALLVLWWAVTILRYIHR